MRRVLLALSALSMAATFLPATADAQSTGRPQQRDRQDRDRQDRGGQGAEDSDRDQRERPRALARLNRRANAGPCPYVKILYDAARFVELADGRASSSAVGFTGEIEGVGADCSYRDDDPITVDLNLLFNLGRGPMAQADSRTYRYWIAVTERNSAVLTKEYIDLAVDFEGAARTSVRDERTIVIPRANTTIAGSNFEILVGFDVTPAMAEFNRNGSRFRVNAGQAAATPPPSQ